MLSNLRVPADAMMRQLLGEGYVGRVHQVLDYRFNGQYADSTQPLHWRQSREFSGINFQYWVPAPRLSGVGWETIAKSLPR